MCTKRVKRIRHNLCTKDKWAILIADVEQMLRESTDSLRSRGLERNIKLLTEMMENDEPFIGEYNGYPQMIADTPFRATRI